MDYEKDDDITETNNVDYKYKDKEQNVLDGRKFCNETERNDMFGTLASFESRIPKPSVVVADQDLACLSTVASEQVFEDQ
ncbi:hypothetical protein BASA62_003629 [Batrachochytrium salamandrivorans]|nr:hypothetical protein BASA62_003629 [Batrachochytrium salamandrivorans]